MVLLLAESSQRCVHIWDVPASEKGGWECRFCWIRYEGNKKVLRQEGEAATALARQDPDTLRKLITDVRTQQGIDTAM